MKFTILPCIYSHHICITKEHRSRSKNDLVSCQLSESASLSIYNEIKRQCKSNNRSATASAIS